MELSRNRGAPRTSEIFLLVSSLTLQLGLRSVHDGRNVNMGSPVRLGPVPLPGDLF